MNRQWELQVLQVLQDCSLVQSMPWYAKPFAEWLKSVTNRRTDILAANTLLNRAPQPKTTKKYSTQLTDELIFQRNSAKFSTHKWQTSDNKCWHQLSTRDGTDSKSKSDGIRHFFINTKIDRYLKSRFAMFVLFRSNSTMIFINNSRNKFE